MSYEQFKEFERQLSKYLSKFENDSARCPLLNSNYSLRTCYIGPAEENVGESSDCCQIEQFPTCDLLSSERCCIAVRKLCGWLRCNRRRSGRVLTVDLERIAMAKNLDLGVSDEDPHMGICLFHWRLIKYGKSDVFMEGDEAHDWEGGEFESEKVGRLSEMSDSVNAENFVSSDQENSDGEVDSAGEKTASSWRDGETVRSNTSDDSDEEGEQGDSEDDDNGLCALSAASLRRYRKFFMIPTKASASKHAMLEGVEHHFERLPVDSNDAIIHFIYTAKNRTNIVE